MKKVIRVSLLMMFILTLIQNVNAEESSIDNDSLQINQIETMENNMILDKIPEEISLDNQEEDNFIIEENDTKSKVEIALQNKVKEILEENNIHPEEDEIEYSIENKKKENSIYDFTVHIKQKESEEITKDIKVKYNQTTPKEEEKQQLLDELLGETKQMQWTEYKDFYTFEGINNPKTILEYLEELFEDDSIHFYYYTKNIKNAYFSYEENGNVYVFIEGVLYELVPLEWKYLSQIGIRQELDNSYVLKQAQEKVEEEYEKNLPENDFEWNEENSVFSKSEEENYGKIEIEHLTEEKLKTYEIQKGNNTTLNPYNPILSIRVVGNIRKIIDVYINNEIINKEYIVIDHEENITIKEDFLKRLSPGTYHVVVRFSDGDAKTTFTLPTEQRVEPQQTLNHSVVYTTSIRNTPQIEETPVETTQEPPLILEETKDTSKDTNMKNENKEIPKNKEEKEPSKMATTPILIVILALGIVGGFGFLLYKKSKEE